MILRLWCRGADRGRQSPHPPPRTLLPANHAGLLHQRLNLRCHAAARRSILRHNHLLRLPRLPVAPPRPPQQSALPSPDGRRHAPPLSAPLAKLLHRTTVRKVRGPHSHRPTREPQRRADPLHQPGGSFRHGRLRTSGCPRLQAPATVWGPVVAAASPGEYPGSHRPSQHAAPLPHLPALRPRQRLPVIPTHVTTRTPHSPAEGLVSAATLLA
jgi:hypothetical protein